MILFLNDWDKYPKAVLHIETTNKSFVRLAMAFKREMGVKNHAFMLQLHNHNLIGIDPFDTSLTKKEEDMILEEIIVNPFYFFREVARVPQQGSLDSSLFISNRSNIALYWLFFNNIITYVEQIRQTGKSVSVDTLMVGLLSFWCSGTEINMITKDDATRQSNVERLKNMFDALPLFLNMRNSKDVDNTKTIGVSSVGNIYKSHVGRSSEEGAKKVARGQTSPIQHVDEAVYVSNIGLIFPSAMTISSAAVDSAKENNAPYGKIITSTAGWLGTESGKYMYGLYSNATLFSEKYYDLNDRSELEEIVRTHKRSGRDKEGKIIIRTPIMLVRSNHRQLGKTDAWLRGKLEENAVSGSQAEVDFLNIWQNGAEKSLFDKETLELLISNEKEPLFKEPSTPLMFMDWYVSEKDLQEHVGRHLVIGMDTSEGLIGGDGMTIVVVDVETGATIGVGKWENINTMVFAEFVFHMLKRFSRAVLMPEGKSTGTAILDRVFQLMDVDNMNPFKRIFNWIVNDATDDDKKKETLRDAVYQGNTTRHKKEFGFRTSGFGRASRDKLYGETFYEAIKYLVHTIHDSVMIKQLRDLREKDGRIDHVAGSHDDTIVAWLLSYFFLTRAKNLSYYGIDSTKCLQKLQVNMTELTDDIDRDFKRGEQIKIKNDMVSLLQRFDTERDDTIRSRIRTKIAFLSTLLDKDVSETLSLEGRIKELETLKRVGIK